MKTIETGIDWMNVQAEMKRAEWMPSDDCQIRQVLLGSVFSLMPSGKYYMPWACSNVDPCESCNGRGTFPTHRKRRIIRKWANQAIRGRRKADHLRSQGMTEYSEIRRRIATYRPTSRNCEHCGGQGSREAYLDSLFQERLESEASKLGFSVDSGEGDPCDIFVSEVRGIEDADELTDD